MMTDLPAPLISPEVDLRDFGFMPLDVVRLRDSDLMALSTGDEFKTALKLWCIAWHQRPAASLPKDDRVLAHLTGVGPSWKKLKAGALRGFIECSDGRLYHPVIAEKAAEAWKSKLERKELNDHDDDRKSRYRMRLKQLSAELRDLGVVIPKNRSLEALEQILADAKRRVAGTSRGHSVDMSGDASGDGSNVPGTLPGTPGDITGDAYRGLPGMAMTGTGTGTGIVKGQGHVQEAGTRAETVSDETLPAGDENRPPDSPPHDPDPPPAPTRAAAVCVAMRAEGLMTANPSHAVLLELLKAGAEIGEFTQAAKEAVAKHKRFDYALAIVRNRRAEAAAFASAAGNGGSKPAESARTWEPPDDTPEDLAREEAYRAQS